MPQVRLSAEIFAFALDNDLLNMVFSQLTKARD